MYKDIGHLISIENKIKKILFNLFLHPTDEDSLPVYENVVGEIRRITLPAAVKDKVDIKIRPVAEFHSLEEDYPSIDISTVFKLPVEVLFNKRSNGFKERLFLTIVKNVADGLSFPFPTVHMNAVVTGADFFDREETLAQIQENLSNDQNVLLCAPRRYGKTSLARSLYETAGGEGYLPVMVDLENIPTPVYFLAQIIVTFESQSITDTEKEQRIHTTVKRIEHDWRKEGYKFFSALNPGKRKLLFLLDECPYMLDTFLGKERDSDDIQPEKKEQVNRFLGWFAEIRNTISDRAVFLMTGSVHLATYLKDNDLSSDNFADFLTINLPYFTPDACRDYIEALLIGRKIFLKEDHIDKISELNTPGIPYFIQITMIHVEDLYRRNSEFEVTDLERIYEEKITGPDGRRHFDTFERHFKRYGKRRDSGARAILHELAQSGEEGIAEHRLIQIYKSKDRFEESDFEILIGNLEYDFYIEKIQDTDRYRFQSRILKDYWRKNQRV